MNLLNLKLLNYSNLNLKTCKYYYLKYLKQFINFKFLVQKYKDLAKVMDNYRSKTRKKWYFALFSSKMNDFCTFPERFFESLSVISLKKSKEHHLLEYLAASLVAQKVDR